MNLVYDLRYASDHFPGIGTHAYALARAWLERPGAAGLTFLWDARARNSRFDLAPLRGHPRARWHEVRVPPLALGTALGTGRCLERLGADLFMSPFWLRPEGTRVPTVLTLHDVFPLAMGTGTGPVRRWAYRWAMRRAAGADAVLTSSRFSRAEILRHTPIPAERLHVVPLGVPPYARESQRPAGAPEGAFALTVGTNRAHKGHETLAAAWRSFAGAPPLALVSAGRETRGGFSLAASASAIPGVHALGAVTPAELEWLYAHATLVLVPSRYEGFGLPLLEAASRGAPVVGSDLPALREIGEGVARFVPPGDAAAWARAVRELAADGAARDAMRAAGRERARGYGYAECAARVEAVVHEVARARGAVPG